MLTRLRYASTLAHDTTMEEIDSIVQKAATANRARGITGVLAVEGSSILQILEGPTELVSALFDRIASDPRHTGVVELDRESIEVSRFDDWGMIRWTMPIMLMMSEDIS